MKLATITLALAGLGNPVLADASHALHQEGAVRSETNSGIAADTDILAAPPPRIVG